MDFDKAERRTFTDPDGIALFDYASFDKKATRAMITGQILQINGVLGLIDGEQKLMLTVIRDTLANALDHITE